MGKYAYKLQQDYDDCMYNLLDEEPSERRHNERQVTITLHK